MAREVDEKATRKALARIQRAKEAVERAIAKSEDRDAAEAARSELTDWEAEFMASVEERLGKFGSAFADPRLGRDGEALSRLQLAKLKEIENKAKGKGGFKRGSSFKSKGSGFKRKGAPRRSKSRDINADRQDFEASETPTGAREAPPDAGPESAAPPPGFRVIRGGRDDD